MRRKPSWVHILLPILVFISLLALAPQVSAENIVANFTDGDGTDSPDAYVGKDGAGWAGPWVPSSAHVGSSVVEVLDSTEAEKGYQELKTGSGNYLDVVATSDSTTAETSNGNMRHAVNRDYTDGNTDNFDPALPHQIQFTVRINENMGEGTTFNTWNYDQYWVCDLSSYANSTSSSMRWGVTVHGGQQSGSQVQAKEWRFIDWESGTSFPLGTGTGIFVQTGGVYDFTITVYPDTGIAHGKWDATISDGTNSHTETDMQWRSSSSTIGGILNAGFWAGTAGEIRDWSIDNIQISQVPEPSTIVLLLFGTLGAALLCSARNR